MRIWCFTSFICLCDGIASMGYPGSDSHRNTPHLCDGNLYKECWWIISDLFIAVKLHGELNGTCVEWVMMDRYGRLGVYVFPPTMCASMMVILKSPWDAPWYLDFRNITKLLLVIDTSLLCEWHMMRSSGSGEFGEIKCRLALFSSRQESLRKIITTLALKNEEIQNFICSLKQSLQNLEVQSRTSVINTPL